MNEMNYDSLDDLTPEQWRVLEDRVIARLIIDPEHRARLGIVLQDTPELRYAEDLLRRIRAHYRDSGGT